MHCGNCYGRLIIEVTCYYLKFCSSDMEVMNFVTCSGLDWTR
jgi:hypothetical protein